MTLNMWVSHFRQLKVNTILVATEYTTISKSSESTRDTSCFFQSKVSTTDALGWRQSHPLNLLGWAQNTVDSCKSYASLSHRHTMWAAKATATFPVATLLKVKGNRYNEFMICYMELSISNITTSTCNQHPLPLPIISAILHSHLLVLLPTLGNPVSPWPLLFISRRMIKFHQKCLDYTESS